MALRIPVAVPGRSGNEPVMTDRYFFLKVWILIIWGVCASAMAAETPPDRITAIDIEIDSAPSDPTDWESIVRGLLDLAAGQPFDADRLKQDIETLKTSRLFAAIHVDSHETSGGLRLIWRLTPYRRIKEINIGGAYPLFEKQIRRVMSVAVGDPYIPAEMPEQETRIEKLYRQEGFESPRVAVRAVEDPADGNYIVGVDIKNGPYDTLDSVDFSGNRAFSDTRLLLKLSTWRTSLLPGSAGRFSENRLKTDVKNLTEFYHHNDYPDAEITYTINRLEAGTEVELDIAVREGPRYTYEFIGNQFLSDRQLRKHLSVYEKGNRQGRAVRLSRLNMRRHYRSEGFLSARVEVPDTDPAEAPQGVRVIRYVITEGPRTVTASLRLKGNQSFSAERLKEFISTEAGEPFRPTEFDKDRRAVYDFYRSNGFNRVQIEQAVEYGENKGRADATLTIREGIRQQVAAVEFSGDPVLARSRSLEHIELKPGAWFRGYMLESDENELAAAVASEGYPYVQVTGHQRPMEDPTRIAIDYRIDPGPRVTLNQVVFSGNLRTRESVLRNKLVLKPGDPFTAKKMLASQRNLRNLSNMDQVQIRASGLKRRSEQVDLFVEVEEKRPYYIEAGLGYQSENGFFANGRVGDINFLGSNIHAWTGAEVSQIGYHGEIGLSNPSVLGTETAADVLLYAEQKEEFNQQFQLRRWGATLGAKRKLFDSLSGGVSVGFEQRKQIPTDGSEPENPDELDTRSVVVTSPSLTYDSRDSFLLPRKGTFAVLNADFSNGLQNDLDDFLKVSIDVRQYWSPFERLTLAFLGRAGHLQPLGSTTDVPPDQLFYLGGTSSVRGYKENLLRFDSEGDPVGGRRSYSGSLESRIDLGNDFELTFFYDIGRLEQLEDESVAEKWRSSVGVGLRYITPIGPIGLLYGHKLDPEDGESPGRIHFSIGYTF